MRVVADLGIFAAAARRHGVPGTRNVRPVILFFFLSSAIDGWRKERKTGCWEVVRKTIT